MAESNFQKRLTWEAGDITVDKRAATTAAAFHTDHHDDDPAAGSYAAGPGSTAPTRPTSAAPGPVQVGPSGTWRGALGFMDQWSADQRMLAAPQDGVRSRPLPLPLLVQGDLAPGHDGGKLGVGVVDRVWVEGHTVMGEGRFDLEDPLGAQLARKVGLGFIRFVSLDVDDATQQQVLVDADGNVVADGNPEDPALAIGDVFSGWRVMGATIVAHPAFPDALIALSDAQGNALTAAAYGEIVGYNPDWGCVKPDGDAWTPADCADPDAVPAAATGDAPFDPEQATPAAAADGAAEEAVQQPPADATGKAPGDAEEQPKAADGVAPPPADITADPKQAQDELNPDAAPGPGCVMPHPDGTWTPCDCQAEGAVPANPAGDGPAAPAPAGDGTSMAAGPAAPAPAADGAAGPTHAGLAVKAMDTGRVLLLQRSMDDPTDPAAGRWEFPGGGIEDGETPREAAVREFSEETGISLPLADDPLQDGWTSANGVYQCFVLCVPTEDLGLNPDADDRAVLNPDDPDGDRIEVVAWWDVDDLPDMTALREEVRATPWQQLKDAAPPAAPAPAPAAAAGQMGTTPDGCEPCQAVAITAAAADTMAPGWTPPAAWFEAPAGSDGPYSIRVDEDGRVAGYLAAWGTCHVGYAKRCVPPPRSHTDYSYFNIRPVRTSSGTVHCGLLTMDTGHANLSASASAALAHYDNTGTQAAVVRVGEDQHGIWAVGAVLPFVTPDQRLKLSLASFSGDWRQIRGGAELIAALAVNTPGFPLAARKTGTDNSMYALVAAGALAPDAPALPDPAQQPAPAEDATGRATLAADPVLLASLVADELEGRQQRRVRADAATSALTAFRVDAHGRLQQQRTRRVDLARQRITQVQPQPKRETPIEIVGTGAVPTPSNRDIGLAKNWVAQQGGLPSWIQRVSDHLIEKGMDQSRAIATAVNAAKKACLSADGLNWPGIQKVNPGTKAEACAAVQKWEAMKAAARAN